MKYQAISIGGLHLRKIGGNQSACSTARLLYLTALLGLAVCARGDVSQILPKGFNEAIEGSMYAQLKDVTTKFGRRLEAIVNSYDFGTSADNLLKNLNHDKGYLDYLIKEQRMRETDPNWRLETEAPKILLRYAQSQTNIPSDIRAWLRLEHGHDLSWAERSSAYHMVESSHSNDFALKVTLLLDAYLKPARPLTLGEWKEWFEIVKVGFASGEGSEQRGFYLMSAAMAMGEIGPVDPNREVITQIHDWLEARRGEYLRVGSAIPAGLDAMSCLSAVSLRDFGAAVDYAGRAGFHVMVPLFLAEAGRLEEAGSALEAELNSSRLTESERIGLVKFRPYILTLARKFEQAHAAIDEARKSPLLSETDRKSLEVLEKMLIASESAK